MDVKELLKKWEESGGVKVTAHEYKVRLPVHDAARTAALAEMYPHKNESEIITDLLTVILDELEASFPYVQGPEVIAEDELGDPIYEDIGPTPRFLALTKKHAARLESKQQEKNESGNKKNR